MQKCNDVIKYHYQEMEQIMKTNCKKWKYLLCAMAVMTAFSSNPYSTLAADMQVRLVDNVGKKQETTSDKMNSAENNREFAVTAGAADVLDTQDFYVARTVIADASASEKESLEKSIIKKSNALAAFTKGMMVLQPQ